MSIGQISLGSQGSADWLDLSDYVVHFARGDDGYATMLAVLGEGVVKCGPSPFGCARRIEGLDAESQRVVCFSEIPLGFLHRIVRRRKTSFGVGFHKRFILDRGGAPLWYLELGTPQQLAVSELMARGTKGGFDADDPIWKLTPFIDFASGPSSPYSYDFRWEREWRVGNDLHFCPENVAFLFIPEDLHSAAWCFFCDAVHENIGPGYFCHYIDPTWSVEKVREALGAPPGPP